MLTLLVALLATATSDPKALPAAALKLSQPHSGTNSDAASAGVKGYGGRHGQGGGGGTGVPGIDSLQNWTGQFTFPGYDSNGNPQSVWPYAMVGQPPESGRVTHFRAPVIPVVVELLGADGNVATSFNGTPLVFDPRGEILHRVLESPIFETWPYTSGVTEWADAILRAAFFNRIDSDDNGWDCDHGWHNLLDAQVKTTRTMQIPYGYWFYFYYNDGSLAGAEVDDGAFSNALFPTTYPVDNSTVIGAAELAGDMTTRDITTLLFNNIYLYEGGNPNNCCVLGFHSYDYEPGTPSNGNLPRLYVFAYASYIGPELFNYGFLDITALSHEISELYNDPFGNNATPWYLSPSGLCQNNLETGDVIEGLTSNAVFTIQKHQHTYHVQNEVLFPWFAWESPSPALNGAYSFPDETTLTALSPPNLLPNCVPGP